MSVSDDNLYEDLSLSGSVPASNEEFGSPNKLNELNLFEECIISKETEKRAKILSDLQSQLEKSELELKATKEKCDHLKEDNITLLRNISSLWKTAMAQLRDKDNKIRTLQKEKEAIIFRRAMRQIPKDELDRVVSRITAYNKEDLSDFLQILDSRKNEELKIDDSRKQAFPKVSYKCNSDVKESVLGVRVSEKNHSEAQHLKKLQIDKKNVYSVPEKLVKYRRSGSCDYDSRKKVERNEKVSDDEYCDRRIRNRPESQSEVTDHNRDCKEVGKKSSDNIYNCREKTKSSNNLKLSSDANRYSSHKTRHSPSTKEVGQEPYENNTPFTLTEKSSPKILMPNDMEDGEIGSDDDENNYEEGENLRKSEVDFTQQKVNDIRAWRIPKLISRKLSDGKENKSRDSNEKLNRNTESNSRSRSSKTLSEKNDTHHHSLKARDNDERTISTRNRRDEKYNRSESGRSSPRKRNAYSRQQSHGKTFERRRESDRMRQNYVEGSELESHNKDSMHRKSYKNDSWKDTSILVENLRERKLRGGHHMRSVSRQPHHNIYKERRVKKELRESYHREYERCLSQIQSRERSKRTLSSKETSAKDVKRHHNPSHISRDTRKSRSGSSHRSQNLTNVDREKSIEKHVKRDSSCSSSKSDNRQNEHSKISSKDKRGSNRDCNDYKDIKSRDRESNDKESSERNKKALSTKTSEKYRQKSDRKLEKKSRENNMEFQAIIVGKDKKFESLDKNEKGKTSASNREEMILSKEQNQIVRLESLEKVNSPHTMTNNTTTPDPSNFQFSGKFSDHEHKEQNQIVFPESSEKLNSPPHTMSKLISPPHTVSNTAATPDPPNFRFSGNFSDHESRKNVALSFDESSKVTLKHNTPLLDKNYVHSVAEKNQREDCLKPMSPVSKKNKGLKDIVKSLSGFSDTESSVAFPLTAKLSEKVVPEEDTFDGFIKRQKEIHRPESVILQNDDSEMSLLKYIGNDPSKQKSDQISAFIAVSPPPFEIPLLKPPVVQIDNEKPRKPLALTEIEVDSSKKELNEPSETNYLSRQDHLSPVCSLPSVGFPVPTPSASRLPYSLNALQSMETPHKTLSTSSCSPIPVATPLDIASDITQNSTPPPLSSTLKSSTPVVAFDLDKKPSFVRDKALQLLKKTYRNEDGSIQPINVSLPTPPSVPNSEKSSNVAVEHTSDREGHSYQNISEKETYSVQSSTATKPDNLSQSSQNKAVDLPDSSPCNSFEINESGKKKIPFVTISKEVSKNGELFSTHDQYGFAASFYKNLDEFQHDWPSRNKSAVISKKSSVDKVSQEKTSCMKTTMSTPGTTDSNSCSNTASSSSSSNSGSSSTSSSSSSSSTTTSSSNNTESRSTSPSKSAENKSNKSSSSQNSPFKTSFKDALTVSPAKKKAVKSPVEKQSPKKHVQKPCSSLMSPSNENDATSPNKKTLQTRNQSSKSPFKKRTRRIKPTPVPKDYENESNLSNLTRSTFDGSQSSNLSSGTEFGKERFENQIPNHNINPEIQNQNTLSILSSSPKVNDSGNNCCVSFNSDEQSFRALLNDPILTDKSALFSVDCQTPKSRKDEKMSKKNSPIEQIQNVSTVSADFSQKLLRDIPCSTSTSETYYSTISENKTPDVSINTNNSCINKTPKYIKITTPENVTVFANKCNKRPRSITPSNVDNVISIVYTGEDEVNSSQVRRSSRARKKPVKFCSSPEISPEKIQSDTQAPPNVQNSNSKLFSDESKVDKGNISKKEINNVVIFRPIKRRKVCLGASSTSSASVR